MTEKLIAGKTAAATYLALESDRDCYLERARLVAELTVPYLMPREGYNGGTLPTPYQSIGARGVSSMASKLLLTLFPPGNGFMRYEEQPGTLDQLPDGDTKTEVQKQFALTEDATHAEVEARAMRPYLYELLKQWLVAGNVCLFADSEERRTKVHHLDTYVLKRDPEGAPIIGIIRETTSRILLPEAFRQMVTREDATNEDKGAVDLDSLEIYTAIVRTGPDSYEVWQEVDSMVVPGTEGTYSEEELPFRFLRSEPVAGQSYSYGYFASLLGDLASLEGLMKALVEASAASSRLVFLVKPNATTSIRELNECPNGGFVAGMENDVVPMKVDKAADMGVAFNMIERLQTSLSFAFLLNQSVQRSGERVTAEEIRFLAQELEDVHAGSYSLLTQELQLPLVKIILKYLRGQGMIPDIPEDLAQPTIVTGLAALGRGHDLQKMELLTQILTRAFGPEVTSKYMKVGVFARSAQIAVGLAGEDLVESDQAIQQMEQQQQAQAMVDSLGQETLRQFGPQAAGQQPPTQ